MASTTGRSIPRPQPVASRAGPATAARARSSSGGRGAAGPATDVSQPEASTASSAAVPTIASGVEREPGTASAFHYATETGEAARCPDWLGARRERPKPGAGGLIRTVKRTAQADAVATAAAATASASVYRDAHGPGPAGAGDGHADQRDRRGHQQPGRVTRPARQKASAKSRPCRPRREAGAPRGHPGQAAVPDEQAPVALQQPFGDIRFQTATVAATN